MRGPRYGTGMNVGMGFTVDGAEEMEELLSKVAPKLAQNIARQTVHAVAGVARKEIKGRVPVKTGGLKKSIHVKRRRMRMGKPISDVKVRWPEGAHWFLVEDGTVKSRPSPYLKPALASVNARLPEILRAQFTKKYVAAVNRARRRRRT